MNYLKRRTRKLSRSLCSVKRKPKRTPVTISLTDMLPNNFFKKICIGFEYDPGTVDELKNRMINKIDTSESNELVKSSLISIVTAIAQSAEIEHEEIKDADNYGFEVQCVKYIELSQGLLFQSVIARLIQIKTARLAKAGLIWPFVEDMK